MQKSLYNLFFISLWLLSTSSCADIGTNNNNTPILNDRRALGKRMREAEFVESRTSRRTNDGRSIRSNPDEQQDIELHQQ